MPPRTTLTLLDLPMAIVVTTLDGCVVQSTARAERLLGRPVVGLALEALVRRGHRALVTEKLSRLVAGRDVTESSTLMVTLALSGGHSLDVDLELSLAAGGVPSHVVAVLRPHAVDLEPTTPDAQSLEHAEQLALVTHGARVGLWKWNPVTGAAFFSAQWLAMGGYRHRDLPPHMDSLRERCHPDDLALCSWLLTEHLEGRSPHFESSHRLKHKDGHWLYVKSRGKVVERDARGRATRFLGLHVDATAEHEAALLARQAVQGREAFFAGVSHELRTPLNAVIGLSEAVGDGVYGPLNPKQQQTLETIHDAGHALLGLLNEILDFARAQTGDVALDPVDTPLVPLVDECLQDVQGAARAKGQSLVAGQRPDGDVLVLADRHHLRSAIVTLLENAVATSPEGATIVADVLHATAQAQVELVVTDAAPPLAGNGQQAVFAPFGAVTDSRTGRSRPAGLRLALVKSIATLLGGGVRVEAHGADGNRFVVTLPVPRRVGPAGRESGDSA